MTFDDADTAYPFDPRFAGRSDVLKNLEKLRAFEDPGMRRNVFELWTNVTKGRAPPPAPVEDESDRRFP